MDDRLASLFGEIQVGLEWLDENLPTRIDGMEISAKSKIPYKVLWCRGAFGWRFAELCRGAAALIRPGAAPGAAGDAA